MNNISNSCKIRFVAAVVGSINQIRTEPEVLETVTATGNFVQLLTYENTI